MSIVSMKRITLVTLSQKGDELLRLLQKLSVLHPEPIREKAELGSLDDLRHRLNVQFSIIRDIKSIDAPEPEGELPELIITFSEVEKLMLKLSDLDERIKSRRRLRDQLLPWGDFNPDEIKSLGRDGLGIRLWRTESSRFGEISTPEGTAVKKMSDDRGQTFFITLSLDLDVVVKGADLIELSDERLSDVEADLERLEYARDAVLKRIGEMQAAISALVGEHEREENEYDYRTAILRAFDDGDVKAFTGWIPASREEEVVGEVGKFEVPVVVNVRKALPDEKPPVLTSNFSIARTMEPLLRLLGIPDYRGLDPALFFAPFMMLFFGICLGDVGYGIAMIAGAYVIKGVFRKYPGAKVAANITILFGIATIAMGLVMGSVFGVAPGGREWILLDVSYEYGDPMLLFYISIALGVIQLTLAFFMAVLSEPSWHVKITRLGSIALIWGGVLVLLGIGFWKVLIITGILAVVLFSSDSRNPFKRIGIGLWGLYSQTGLVGDIMSYSRLFGLGVATAAIAGVVNTLAEQASSGVSNVIISTIIMIAILVVGHVFNMAIGIIGALVHPARLHAVEALPKFVHFDGVAYKPLVRD